MPKTSTEIRHEFDWIVTRLVKFYAQSLGRKVDEQMAEELDQAMDRDGRGLVVLARSQILEGFKNLVHALMTHDSICGVELPARYTHTIYDWFAPTTVTSDLQYVTLLHLLRRHADVHEDTPAAWRHWLNRAWRERSHVLGATLAEAGIGKGTPGYAEALCLQHAIIEHTLRLFTLIETARRGDDFGQVICDPRAVNVAQKPEAGT